MHTSTFFALLLAFLAAADPVVKRDAITVEADLQLVTTDTETLDTLVTNFSNTDGTLEQAAAIHADVITLGALITKTANDVKNSGKFNDIDGNVILGEVKTLEPVIIDSLTQITNKKTGIDRLEVTCLALNDLKTLQSNAKALENALISAAPADLVPQATSIASAIDAAFTSAIAAYS